MAKKFELEKNGHRVTTTVATEAVQLKANGYREVKKGEASKPASETKK